MGKSFSQKFGRFVLVESIAAKGGSISFKSYTDFAGVFGHQGLPVEYVMSKDDKGKDKGKWFTLNQQHRVFATREGENDIYNKSQFDFLANSPWCEGSPNAQKLEVDGDTIWVGCVYKVLDNEKDAETALDAGIRRAEAQMSATNLDEETLSEVAAHIGEFGKPDKLLKYKVFDWAGRRPDDYFEVLESGDRPVRAIIRKAIADGTFTKQGPLIKWGNEVIGTSEDNAVSRLLNDKHIFDALKESTDLKVSTEVKGKPGRKPGRPKTATV